MPLCQKCENGFPNAIVVAGKRRNVQNRKYCFDCSPFGQHNTRKLHGLPEFEQVVGPEKACARCGRKYVYDRRKGHRRDICNSCSANQQRRNRKAKAVAYKGGKCEQCGYCRCLRALGFHHRDRDEKEFTVSQMMSMAWHRVKIELDKCDLICSNCHMEEEERLSSKEG